MPVKLEHVLTRVQALPALPASAMRVIALTKHPDADIKDLENIIAQDPALAASILRQANSAHYGYARRISTLGEAIVILGFQAIQGLALASAVAPVLKGDLPGYCIDQEGLWKHCMLTAMVAKRLCRRLLLPFGDVAFTAGLLHDIGKLIISVYLQQVGSYIMDKVEKTNVSYAEMEQKVIGFDHGTVGGFIVKRWNLPDDLVDAISNHHDPFRSQNHRVLSSVIHLANSLANTLGLGSGVDSFLNPLRSEVLQFFDLKDSDIELLLAEVVDLISDPTLFE